MKLTNKFLLTTLITSLICFSANAKDIKLGKDLTLKDKTKVSEILGKPINFISKNVLIEGKVLDVCTERGCWMKVSSDKKKESIKLKVNDGEMVFPVSAVGKNVKAEGSLYKIEITKEDLIEMEQEKAKQNKTLFDPKLIKEGKTIYMFKPKSVVITE